MAILSRLGLKRSNMKSKIDDYRKIASATSEVADTMAISILGWLSSQPDMMSRFLALSGLDAGSIRQAATQPGFFGGLTSFLMGHEPTLMQFCEETGAKPAMVAACDHHFNGSAEDQWS
jgi:hypothetical protein